MDYQVDPAKIPVPWGKIIGVNVAVTIIVAFVFNLAMNFILPSGIFTRVSELERKTAELQVTVEKFSGKIKIGN
jgi:hypothetical protein